ncbi:hypothetical protein VTL71DRAFT_2216 [Oculimacula yallundae]|uniref:Fungal N-terminal domain-containing protein n=1 Tax=Oculimacula yallundae TaxID=86028 RepID=A0ABR4C8T1_9HELO
MSFGFSVGDFLAALELVHTVVTALHESGDSSDEYRSIVTQLRHLETALIAVALIEVEEVQHAEGVALQEVASQCQTTINDFWDKIKKYQPHLRSGESGNRWRNRVKNGWMKVRWALCEREDLVRFKANLMGHTASINLLIATIGVGATTIGEKKSESRQQSLSGKIQESYFGCMNQFKVVLEGVASGIKQGKQILQMMANVIELNMKTFQAVIDMHNIISYIPRQRRVVFFLDALGEHMTFDLGFIQSAEALTSVLRSNLKNIGSGARKIDKGEFAIKDLATDRDVNLELPWKTCFIPGQRVAMSMIFKSSNYKEDVLCCPQCSDSNEDTRDYDQDIECRKCRMVYRQSLSISLAPLDASSLIPRDIFPRQDAIDAPPTLDPKPLRPSRKRSRVHIEVEDIALFRRVRIKTEIKVPAPESPKPVPNITVDCDPSSDPEVQQGLKAKRDLVDESVREINSSDLVVQTQRMSKEEWEVHRDFITALYAVEGIKLKDIRERLEEDYGFVVNERLLKYHMGQWNIGKNLQSTEMELIIHKQQQRSLKGTSTRFRVRGQPVQQAKIDRWCKRTGYSPSSASPIPSTPSDVSYIPASDRSLSPQPGPARQRPEDIQQPQSSRGPIMGYFDFEAEEPHPIDHAETASLRSLIIAQEAQMERQAALRLERQQREQHLEAANWTVDQDDDEAEVEEHLQRKALEEELPDSEMSDSESEMEGEDEDEDAEMTDINDDFMYEDGLQERGRDDINLYKQGL